jgi:hypothetical protein
MRGPPPAVPAKHLQTEDTAHSKAQCAGRVNPACAELLLNGPMAALRVPAHLLPWSPWNCSPLKSLPTLT